MVAERGYGTRGKLVMCDEPLTGYGVVLGTLEVWAERLAQLRLLVQLVHSAQEMEPFLQSVCTCTMSWVFSELLRLRFWHSHERDHRDRWQTGGRR